MLLTDADADNFYTGHHYIQTSKPASHAACETYLDLARLLIPGGHR